jgi:hypothetical protein
VTPEQWATTVTAVATVIYTIGTFLLWWVTRKSTKVLDCQLRILEIQINRQAAINEVLVTNATLDAHREIWFSVISNPLFASLLYNGNPQGQERITGEFLGSILINQCARIHLNYATGIYDSAEFDSFARDARYLFSFPLVKWRWEGVCRYHKKDFVEFVESQISV